MTNEIKLKPIPKIPPDSGEIQSTHWEGCDKVHPACAMAKKLDYLNKLRESGKTNMFGAAPYIMLEFGLNRQEAEQILKYWMETFEARNPC